MNQKGGVGKTTTTVNVGAALAMRGRRCLLIDLDSQAHSTLHFGIEPPRDAPTVYDILLDSDCSVYEVVHVGRENLDIIPSEVALAAAEVELTTQPGREMILREKLEAVEDQYDYILFDCPPSLGLLTLNALVAAREVIIPMQAHFLPLQGVGKLLETIALVRQRLNRELMVGGIVLCSHDGQTTLAREIVADLRAFFEERRSNGAWDACEIFEPPIRRNIKLAEAPSFGQTIFEYESWCAGAQDYAALSENMLRRWEGPNASVEVVTQRSDHESEGQGRTPPADGEPRAAESADQHDWHSAFEPPLIDVSRRASDPIVPGDRRMVGTTAGQLPHAGEFRPDRILEYKPDAQQSGPQTIVDCSPALPGSPRNVPVRLRLGGPGLRSTVL